MTTEIKLGDIVRLHKVHPCGSYEWKVVSVSANISLECLKCHRRVLLQRRVFERRVKDFVSKSDNYPALQQRKTPCDGLCSEVTNIL
jgi:hypothetical protein